MDGTADSQKQRATVELLKKTLKIKTPKTHYFTLTHNCRIGLPGKARERCRARLHTTVGCSHGDGRRKYDSKRPSSHAQAYVKLQSFNITYTLNIGLCVCVVRYHVNSVPNVKCSLWLRSNPHFPSL